MKYTIPHPRLGTHQVTARKYINYRFTLTRGASVSVVLSHLERYLAQLGNVHRFQLELVPGTGWLARIMENGGVETFASNLSGSPWHATYACIAMFLWETDARRETSL